MLTIYGRRSSSNVQKVMWLVAELGLAHEHVALGGDHGGLAEPAFRALNPHGLIPTIRDGDVVVWESHAILRYIAAQYGPDAFWPESPAARSSVDRWMDWAQTTWQPSFVDGVFWGMYRTPAAQRNNDAVSRAIEACAAHMRQLDAALADRPYLAGDNLTLADIPLGATLYRYFNLEIARPNVPYVEAWRQRLEARPAYQTHVMIAFDALKDKPFPTGR
ncbi:MAG: glutathione S-transferase [Alphaproteobacteria bacterium]|nr:glutathione S-transferase [Alphaproteobacteria bacterium]